MGPLELWVIVHPGITHHFTRLFDQHNALDQKIKNMEDGLEIATNVEIETLKREKLQLKDELYAILKKASAA